LNELRVNISTLQNEHLRTLDAHQQELVTLRSNLELDLKQNHEEHIQQVGFVFFPSDLFFP
jgi:hypothetical protein